MLAALKQANMAYEHNEVPVGAVITFKDEIIAEAYNLCESQKDATRHAEIIAIQNACRKLGQQRLEACDLYVTLEPCAMCAGAIINARIKSLYFGAFDIKAGAAGSVLDLFNAKEYVFNHRVTVYAGIMEASCAEVLRVFFKTLR